MAKVKLGRTWPVRAAMLVAVLFAGVADAAPGEVRPASGSGVMRYVEGIHDWTFTTRFEPARITPGQPVRVFNEWQKLDSIDSAGCTPEQIGDSSSPVAAVTFKRVPPGGFPPTRPGERPVWKFLDDVAAGAGTTRRIQRTECSPPRIVFIARNVVTIPGSVTRDLAAGCYITKASGLEYVEDEKVEGTVAVLSVGGVSCLTGAGGPVSAAAVSGSVTITAPGSTAPRPLTGSTQIAPGAVLDATRGSVRLRDGGTANAVFSRGAFRVGRPSAAGTELTLVGGDFRSCGTRQPSSRAATPTRVVRRLWGTGKGRFRTRGRYAAVTVRGTAWVVEDRCDGTLVRVREGVLQIRLALASRSTSKATEISSPHDWTP